MYSSWPPEPTSKQRRYGWRHEGPHDERVEEQSEHDGGADLAGDA
jgi:hypothetical protein